MTLWNKVPRSEGTSQQSHQKKAVTRNKVRGDTGKLGRCLTHRDMGICGVAQSEWKASAGSEKCGKVCCVQNSIQGRETEVQPKRNGSKPENCPGAKLPRALLIMERSLDFVPECEEKSLPLLVLNLLEDRAHEWFWIRRNVLFLASVKERPSLIIIKATHYIFWIINFQVP